MDVPITSFAPRVVADLRPAADAAATVRTTAPPGTPSQAPTVTPASPAQGGLVARGLMDPRSVSPTGRPDPSGDRELGEPKSPPRVLKPWGVPMLPVEEQRAGRPEPAPESRPATDAPPS